MGQSAFCQKKKKKHSQLSINDFKFIKNIAIGGFGTVDLYETNNNMKLAIKKVNKNKILFHDTKDLNKKITTEQQIINEKDIFKKIENQFVMKLLFSFQDDFYTYLGTQFMFLILIKGQKAVFMTIKKKFLFLIFVKLDFFQVKLYQELSIFIAKTLYIEIQNWKISQLIIMVILNQLILDYLLQRKKYKSIAGTYVFMSPELFNGQNYDKSIDFWAIGVLTFYMLTSGFPFQINETKATYNKEYMENFRFSRYPPVVQDFVNSLLQENVEQRLGFLGFEEIKKHGFFKNIDWDLVYNKIYIPSTVIDFSQQTSYSDLQQSYKSSQKQRCQDLQNFTFEDPIFHKLQQQKEIIKKNNFQVYYDYKISNLEFHSVIFPQFEV